MRTLRPWTTALAIAFVSAPLLALPGCDSSGASDASPVNPEVAKAEGAARSEYAKTEKKSANQRPKSTAGTRR